MIRATAKFTLAKVPLADVEAGYALTLRIISALHSAAPSICPSSDGWFGGVTKPGQKAAPFSDNVEFKARLVKQISMSPSDDYSVHLSSPDGKSVPGQVSLLFIPSFAHLTLSIHRPELAGVDALAIARLIQAVVETMEVSFAFVDSFDIDPNGEEPSDKTSYSSSFATFPHRQCVGWMAYIPSNVTAAQAPTAEALVPTRKGTMVIAVKESFDISNPSHIQAANQIEMDLADHDLLKVIDQSF
jgi:hypothetical protein